MIRGLLNHFNRGEIDQRALSREDVKRVSSSASSMINFIPSRLGNMQYRPGFENLADLDSAYDHRLVPFIVATDDTALIDFYNDKVEFIVNDLQIAVSAVTSTITNGTFTTNIASWTDGSTGGASIAWYNNGGGDGSLSLIGDGASAAIASQTLTGVTETSASHFMRLVIDFAPVTVKIGTSGASSFDIFKGTLKPGEHVLNFTPSSDITITFENTAKYSSKINSVSFDSGSDNLVIDTPLTSATMDSLRYVQSGDIIFCAFDGGKQFQIEHRGDNSWSVVDFRADDGPFSSINSATITMTPAALNGEVTLTASESYFTTDHVGALFKVSSAGQEVESIVSVDTGAGTNSVRVTGVGISRQVDLTRSGIVSGVTVHLQRSADDVSWVDTGTSYTTNGTQADFNDGFDNSVFYYRLYIKAGDNPNPDTVTLSINYDSGSLDGIARVIKYTSTTVVAVQVLSDFGGTDATIDWYEGSWSAEQGHPSSVEMAEGRLFFASDEKVWGSVSDAYYSFDRSLEGDSASILRTIGFGSSDPIKWLKSANQLIFGTTSDELVLRSTSFGEILTQDSANIKSGSTQGSANVEPVKVDSTIFFVQRSGVKIYSLDNTVDQNTFATIDATMLNQSICEEGVHRIAVTRQPETRLFVVLDDGNVAVYTVDSSEDVQGWSRLTMSGTVKDVVVLPDSGEDAVYFVVEHGSSTYLEKMSQFGNCIGGTTSEHFDSFKRYTSPGTTITGLSHQEGETVGVWADGQDRGTYTVSSGQITVTGSWVSVIVGLPYVADYVTSKIVNYDKYTSMTERKRIVDTGLVLMNYWPGSLKVGPTVALLKDLPDIEDGTAVDTTATISDYSELPFEFDSETEADPRIYMRATGPCTVLALSYGVDSERAASTGD